MPADRIRYKGQIYTAATVEDLKKRGDFIGYHCQRGPRRDISSEDTIGMGYDPDIGSGSYGEYFTEIMDMLPFELRDNAMEQGLTEAPDRYDDDYSEWHDTVKDFLYTHGIRWIFVSHNKPLTDYGDYCYAVALDPDAVLHVIPDVGVEDSAEVYIYDSKVATPVTVLLE